MKTRNGFVSNSSSSSFIVVFPRKPESVVDVKTMLFAGRENIPVKFRWDDGVAKVSNDELAAQIFSDIQRRNPDGLSVEQAADMLGNRYHYNVHDNCFSVDDDGNEQSEAGWGTMLQEPYFGVSKLKLDELAEAWKEEEVRSEDFNKQREDYIKEKAQQQGIEIPGDEEDWNSPVSKKFYEFRSDCWTDMEKNDPIWMEIVKKHWEDHNRLWSKIHKLSDDVALTDVKMFLKDNPGFIVGFEYGDNHGDTNGPIGSVLEYGNVWDNVPHIQSSNH